MIDWHGPLVHADMMIVTQRSRVDVPKARISRIDEASWIEAALKLLAEGGIDAVKVEPLSELLGVTKGSFYSRYAGREAFLARILDYWRQESTVAVLSGFGAINESAEERLYRILMLPLRRPDVKERARMEMAIRLWANRDPRAAATMKEIDAYRLQYFQSVLEANGVTAEDSEGVAFLIYAYVMADGTLPGERSERVRAQCREILSAAGSRPGG